MSDFLGRLQTQDAADKIEDLKAENKRLQVALAKADNHPLVMAEGGTSGVDRCHRVINKLEAEVKRLREALADCMMHVDCENLTTQTLHANWQAVLDGKPYNRGNVRVN